MFKAYIRRLNFVKLTGAILQARKLELNKTIGDFCY